MISKSFRTKIRELATVCDDFVGKSDSAVTTYTIGSKTQELCNSHSRLPLDPTGMSGETLRVDSAPEILNNFRILTHAFLIQEWHLFLDEIFQESLLHFLQKKEVARIPKSKVSIRKIDYSTISSIRKSIAILSRDDFAFNRYKDKIFTLKNMFGIEIDEEIKETLRKHIEVRNTFQHHKGIIKEKILNELGSKSITLKDDSNNQIQYNSNNTIKLSKYDLEELTETIKLFSNYFEELK